MTNPIHNRQIDFSLSPIVLEASPADAEMVDAVAMQTLQQSPKSIGPIRNGRIHCNSEGCNKILNFVQKQLKCRCEGVFCDSHRLHSYHKCKYDYLSKSREQIRQKLLNGEARQKGGSNDCSASWAC